MTECERLIQEGIFDESFFKEETICDFLVTTKRKKVWAIEIDILLQVDEICKKHNLKYWLSSGTLLGAIRHNGFIPWDDDLDIFMFRDDYEKFLSIASKELNTPYFLQTPDTDKNYFFSFARVRNINTTMMNKKFTNYKMNMGITIDIFPLDLFNNINSYKNYAKINELVLLNSTYMRLNVANPSETDIQRINDYPGGDPYKRYKMIQKIAIENNTNKDLTKCSVMVCTVYDLKRNTYDIDDFKNTIFTDLYGHMFPIPQGYDNVLKIIYGDYMQYPPVKDRGQWHKDLIIDPDISYLYYISSENERKN